MSTHYDTLGVDKNADPSEIRRAYKKLALENHPDKVPEHLREQASIKFKEISAAYEVLSDGELKMRYDHELEFGASYSDYYDTDPNRGNGFTAADFESFFQDDVRSNMGRNGGGVKQSQYTEDAKISISVTLQDLYNGKTLEMQVLRDVLCKHCSGTGSRNKTKPPKCEKCKGHGFVQKLQRTPMGYATMTEVECQKCKGLGVQIPPSVHKCKKCQGSGLVEESKIAEIWVPAGAPNDFKDIHSGMADERYGKKPGDLIFQIEVQPDDTFERHGADLTAHFDIPLADAICGFSKVLVVHVDGRPLRVTLPPGKVLKPNEHLTLKGLGFNKFYRGKTLTQRGNVYLIPNIVFPENGWCLEKSDIRAVHMLLSPGTAPAPNASASAAKNQNDFENNRNGSTLHSSAPDAAANADDVDYTVEDGDIKYEPEHDEDAEEGSGVNCPTM